MSGELFDLPPCLSPRLQWLERHCLTIVRMENGKYACILDDLTVAVGDDQEEAIVNFCLKYKLRHYNQP